MRGKTDRRPEPRSNMEDSNRTCTTYTYTDLVQPTQHGAPNASSGDKLVGEREYAGSAAARGQKRGRGRGRGRRRANSVCMNKSESEAGATCKNTNDNTPPAVTTKSTAHPRTAGGRSLVPVLVPAALDVARLVLFPHRRRRLHLLIHRVLEVARGERRRPVVALDRALACKRPPV